MRIDQHQVPYISNYPIWDTYRDSSITFCSALRKIDENLATNTGSCPGIPARSYGMLVDLRIYTLRTLDTYQS